MDLKEYKTSLEIDIAEKRAELRSMEAAYAALDTGNGFKVTITGLQVLAGQFARLRVGQAVREYLALKQGPATVDELTEALALGGYEWPKGKSPEGNIRRSLKWNPELEEIGGLIYLKKKKT